MRSRLKTCSHGTACNFIHCFRNPGGDYEWADWDKPPPKYWVKKMAALFGYSDESGNDKQPEQESLGWLRNSSKMFTADTDRYHSRRSGLHEIDGLKGNYSRGHYNEHDVRRSIDRQRHTSDGRNRLKNPNKDNHDEETDSRKKQHVKNRTCYADSDGDWSDRDKDGDRHAGGSQKSALHQIKGLEFQDYRGNSKSRPRETDSDSEGDSSARARERDRRHHCTRKSSMHWMEVSENADDFGDGQNRSRGCDSSGKWFDEERDRGRHYSHRWKSSRHRDKVSFSPDDHEDSRSRTRDSDSGGDLSDGGRKRHHSSISSPSRSMNEVPELRKIQKHRHSSRRDHSNRETTTADLKSDDNETRSSGGKAQRIKYNDFDSDENIHKVGHQDSGNMFPENDKKPKRKFSRDEIFESDSPGQCVKRKKSHDSENIDERGRWEPYKDREKSDSSGCEQYSGKSNYHDPNSDEYHIESSSRSRHGKQSPKGDEIDSTGGLPEFEEDHKRRYRGKHTSKVDEKSN